MCSFAISAFSRLTKYPLLFESLAKYTEEDSEELVSVLRAVERSKEILNHVNQAVREAEDIQRLTEIQRRLDKSGFEKVEHPMAGEFKVCGNSLFSGFLLFCECNKNGEWGYDELGYLRKVIASLFTEMTTYSRTPFNVLDLRGFL
jgi:hypothetical protein